MFSNRPRYRLALIAVALTLAFTALAGLTIGWAADTGSPGQGDEARGINIDVKDAQIAEVLRLLSKASGVNIVLGQGVTGTVEAINLKDVTVEAALAVIAESQNLYYYKKDNIYVICKELPKGAENEVIVPGMGAPSAPGAPASQGAASGGSTGIQPGSGVGVQQAPIGPIQSNATGSGVAGVPAPPAPVRIPEAKVVSGKIVTSMIPLRFANAAQVAAMFGGTVTQTATHPTPDARGGFGYLRGNHGVAQDIFGGYAAPNAGGAGYQQLGGGLGGSSGGRGGTGGSSRGGRSGNQGSSGNTGNTGLGGTGGGGLGGGGGAGGAGGQIQLPEGIEQGDLIGYMPQNSLLVRGTQEGIDELREIITLLDQPVKQVEISTKFIEVQTGAEHAFGIDWSMSNGSLEFFPSQHFADAGLSGAVVRFARGKFDGILAALLSSNRATVVNQPSVVTQNNLYAEIDFDTQIPYFTATVSYNNFGQRTVDYTSDFVDVANFLGVTPRINGDDSITMDLSPELDDTIGNVTGPNGESIPIVTTQTVLTQVTVADGETLVIGGLVRKNESQNVKETPLLSRIPIIGQLFRSDQKSLTNSELLIFVTPRIVREVPAQ